MPPAQPGENEFRWMTKDGRPIWVLARSTVIKDESGKPIGMRGVTFDITDRKEVERRLALLAEISTTGLVTPSFQELARDIARRTADVVGDYCIIRMLREGRLEGVAHAHVAAEAEPVIRRFTEHPDVASRSPQYAEIIRAAADARRQRRSRPGVRPHRSDRPRSRVRTISGAARHHLPAR